VLQSYLCFSRIVKFAIYPYNSQFAFSLILSSYSQLYVRSKLCVRHLITKILRNGPRAHFPFNLPCFGDLCQLIKSNLKRTNILKWEQKGANWCQTQNQLNCHRIWHIWIILPPLGLFLQNKFIFLPLCKNTLFCQTKIFFKTSFDQNPETPLFPIIKFLPRKRVVFAIRGFWSKNQGYFH
jgi:hypothetical protein